MQKNHDQIAFEAIFKVRRDIDSGAAEPESFSAEILDAALNDEWLREASRKAGFSEPVRLHLWFEKTGADSA